MFQLLEIEIYIFCNSNDRTFLKMRKNFYAHKIRLLFQSISLIGIIKFLTF